MHSQCGIYSHTDTATDNIQLWIRECLYIFISDLPTTVRHFRILSCQCHWDTKHQNNRIPYSGIIVAVKKVDTSFVCFVVLCFVIKFSLPKIMVCCHWSNIQISEHSNFVNFKDLFDHEIIRAAETQHISLTAIDKIGISTNGNSVSSRLKTSFCTWTSMGLLTFYIRRSDQIRRSVCAAVFSIGCRLIRRHRKYIRRNFWG